MSECKRRRSHCFKNLTGQKFGKLTVIREREYLNQKQQAVWLCQCECGNCRWYTTNQLSMGGSTHCGCSRPPAHNRDLVGEIFAQFWGHVTRGAKDRDIPFDITREEAWELFLEQDRKCALSGVELFFYKDWKKRSEQQTASLDRIDSYKGYSKENCQWVHKDVNKMKHVYSVEEYYIWCKRVVEHMENKLCHLKDVKSTVKKDGAMVNQGNAIPVPTRRKKV